MSVTVIAQGVTNSVVSKAMCRIGWTLLELQAKTGVEARTIHKILREDLRKIASKWVLYAVNEHYMQYVI